jgi:hypothetical protein
MVDTICNIWKMIAFEMSRFVRKTRPVIILFFLQRFRKVRAILPHTLHKFISNVYNFGWFLGYIISRVT